METALRVPCRCSIPATWNAWGNIVYVSSEEGGFYLPSSEKNLLLCILDNEDPHSVVLSLKLSQQQKAKNSRHPLVSAASWLHAGFAHCIHSFRFFFIPIHKSQCGLKRVSFSFWLRIFSSRFSIRTKVCLIITPRNILFCLFRYLLSNLMGEMGIKWK